MSDSYLDEVLLPRTVADALQRRDHFEDAVALWLKLDRTRAIRGSFGAERTLAGGVLVHWKEFDGTRSVPCDRVLTGQDAQDFVDAITRQAAVPTTVSGL